MRLFGDLGGLSRGQAALLPDEAESGVGVTPDMLVTRSAPPPLIQLRHRS